jgi:hypothetical protein
MNERDLQQSMYLLMEQGEGPDPEPGVVEAPAATEEPVVVVREVYVNTGSTFDPFKGH